MASDPNAKIELDPVEARGARRTGLIYILAGGVVLVIIAFFVVWLTMK